MKNIIGEEYSTTAKPNKNWSRIDNICIDSSYTKKQLDEKRKYDVLQYKKNSAGLTKAQKYSNIRRVNRITCGATSRTISHPPSASGVPGKWDIKVNNEFLAIPTTETNTRTQYSSSGSSNYDYFNITPNNFSDPYKILSKTTIDISFNMNDYIGLSFEEINSYSINDISSARLYVNEIGAISDDNTKYFSDVNHWDHLNGSSSIFGGFYTSAYESISDLSEVAIMMLKYKILEYNYTFIKTLSYASFNDISNNKTFTEYYDNYIDFIDDNEIQKFNIKLTEVGGFNKLSGYIGQYDNKVYFISNRDYLTNDISFANIDETVSPLNDNSRNYIFNNNVKINMSLACD